MGHNAKPDKLAAVAKFSMKPALNATALKDLTTMEPNVCSA